MRQSGAADRALTHLRVKVRWEVAVHAMNAPQQDVHPSLVPVASTQGGTLSKLLLRSKLTCTITPAPLRCVGARGEILTRVTCLARSASRRSIEGNGENDPDAPRRTIGPGGFRRRTDRWVVPESLLVSTADRKLLTLNAEIVSTIMGKVSREFSKQSSLLSTRRFRLELEFATVE